MYYIDTVIEYERKQVASVRPVAEWYAKKLKEEWEQKEKKGSEERRKERLQKRKELLEKKRLLLLKKNSLL